MTLNKRQESDMKLELDKDKLIKILKEQERKSIKNKGYMVRILEFLRVRKAKKSPVLYSRRKSFRKK